MAFDLNKIKAKIVEKQFSARRLAPILELSEASMYEKLSGKTEFKRSEIEKLCKILGISDVIRYFFNL
mgnify:CR=1 FL=1